MPTFYLALEPPSYQRTRLARVMRQLGDRSPLPHITVIPPRGLGPDLSWLPPARSAVAHCQPVTVALGSVSTFHDRVLYLSVTAIGLDNLHRRLVDALREVVDLGTDVNARDFVPHLTLAVARRHRTLPPHDGVVALLGDLPPFETGEVTVCRRDGQSDHYRAWQRLALGTG